MGTKPSWKSIVVGMVLVANMLVTSPCHAANDLLPGEILELQDLRSFLRMRKRRPVSPEPIKDVPAPKAAPADWNWSNFYKKGPKLPKKVFEIIKTLGVYRYQYQKTDFNCQDFSRKLERLFNQEIGRLGQSNPDLRRYSAHFTKLGMTYQTRSWNRLRNYNGFYTKRVWDFYSNMGHAIIAIQDSKSNTVLFVDPQVLSKDSVGLDFNGDGKNHFYKNLPAPKEQLNEPTERNVLIVIFDSFEKANELGWGFHDSRPVSGASLIKADFQNSAMSSR
jgi:hypothetical protein